jgi:hypothetical protein
VWAVRRLRRKIKEVINIFQELAVLVARLIPVGRGVDFLPAVF